MMIKFFLPECHQERSCWSLEEKKTILTGQNVYDWGQVRGSALLIAGSCAPSSTAKIS